MIVYSWQLALAVVLLVIPLLWVVSSLQGQLTQAFDLVRTRVGQLMSEVSESDHGRGRGARVRAGGPDGPAREARDRRTVPGDDRGALALGGAVPDRDVLLRHRRFGHRRAGRVLRSRVGTHVRPRLRVHLPVRRLPPRVHGPARDLRRHADRDRRLAEDPDGARPADRDRRARPRRRVAGGTDPGPHDRAGLFVPRGRAGAARHLGRGRTRHARRDRRPDRRREDHVREAAGPARRPGVGAHPGGRGGSAKRVADIATERDPHGSAGRVPVRHDGARERAVRQTVGERPGRRDRVRRAGPLRLGRRRCRRAWTRRSASEAKRCPSASASSCRSPARRSTSPGC